MNKQYRALLLIFGVFFLFLFGILTIYGLTGKAFNTMDYYFHFFKAKGDCYTEQYTLDACSNYAPLLSFITSPFGNNPLLFLISNMAIFLIFIPMAIFMRTKNLWSLLIYFSSAFVFNVMYAGILAQSLLTLFFVLIMLNEKSVFFDLCLLAIGTFSHSKAIYVLLPLFFYKYLSKYKIKIPFFSFVILQESYFDLHFSIKLMPVINYFYILFMPIQQIALILYFLVSGAFVDYRASLFIPVLLAYFIPPLLKDKDKNIKGLLVITYLIFFLMSFFTWFLDIYLSNMAA